MDSTDWEAELTADVLEDRYGLTASAVEPVPTSTETTVRRVLTDDGRRLVVKKYRATARQDTLRIALDMSEYCRAARLPVPRVHPDVDSYLVTIAQGNAWSVADEAPGLASTSAMTLTLAEHVGTVLGRMHRVLAAYPLPERVQPSRWRTEPVEQALAQCDAVLHRAFRHRRVHGGHLISDLDHRREDLHLHAHRLRSQLPEHLVDHALHAQISRTHLIAAGDHVTGIIGFHGATGIAAWELGRAAFQPRTVAAGPGWAACALAMLAAYREENPTLPFADIQACARITLLDLLFNLHGATTAESELPAAAQANAQIHWSERQTTIRHLLTDLDDLDDTFAALGPDTGRP
ncbi:phosphotransferase [Streptomyces sp. NBC_01390]|uniref:phosphotransferase enzyme family protein n=1 Tax=Streptomyces sp. NBC_01390 TaxID=2903850 RepID=UPI003248DD66